MKMVNSIEVRSYEQLTSEISKLIKENNSLKNKVSFAEMDTDLARRTVSEYAEQLVKIQHKLRALTESVQFLCTQDGMGESKKIDLIRFEVERAINIKVGY